MTHAMFVRSLIPVAILAAVAVTPAAHASFLSARPVWVADRETEKNLFVGFRTVFDCPTQGQPTIRVAASSL
ncbi:MAG: hypothetical protein ABFE13_00735, partial [Phycisphaerales bacterium]